jgi:phosphate transport system permease protein
LKVRRILNSLFLFLCCASFFVAIAPLVSIIGFVVSNGFSVINISFLTENPSATGIGGGIANAIIGSFVTVAIASLIGIPLGLASGMYMSEFRVERYSEIVRFASDVLVGIPSVVTGILVYSLVVLTLHGFSALAGGIALGLIMTPIVTNTTAESMAFVPYSIREAAYALGISKARSMIIVISNAKRGIITGVLLALARAAGETAPLLMTALGSQLSFSGLFSPVNTLTLFIFNAATSGNPPLVNQAWGASFVLLLIVLGINLAVKLTSKQRYRYL